MAAFKRLCVFALVLLVAGLVIPLSSSAFAQDENGDDDPTIETTRTAREQPDDEETGEEDSADAESEASDEPGTDIDSSDDGESTSPNAAAIEVNDIYQTIAQGLAAFDSFPSGIWRITELEPKAPAEAPSVTAPYYGFLYQMDGTTIVRNDTTGKRARLEPGEAYYFSANDTYTRYREDEVSRAWLIEIVPEDADPADAAGTPIYHSDTIGSFPDDTRDLELISGNLMEGESSDLPNFEVDVLVMAPLGTIKVEADDDGVITMQAPAALLVSSGATLTNIGDSPAVYIIAKVGPPVGDAGAANTDPDEASTDEASAGDEGDETLLDTDADGLTDADEAVYGTDPAIADTDFDGYADGDEVLIYGTDPLDSNSWP